METLLSENGVTALATSAACGADLIGLSEAGKLGIRRRVVLPFSREKFRAESVIDRPGEWGHLYDMVLDEVSAMGDLVITRGAEGCRSVSGVKFGDPGGGGRARSGAS